MIKSFKHKGLEKYFYNDIWSGINANHAPKISRILDRLEASINPQDMNLQNYRLHELKGKEKGTWSVWINGNWRITFRFYGADVTEVDCCDYH